TIAKAGAGFRSLADTWADTTTPHGPAHADCARRPCRIRARADPRQDRRRAEACASSWRQVRPQAQTDAAPAAGGDCTSRSWRDAGRHRPVLQREPSDHYAAGAMTGTTRQVRLTRS